MARGSTIIVVGAIGLFWGLNWPAVKTMLTEIPPVTIRAVSLSAASLLLALFVAYRGERLMPERSEIGQIVLAGLLTVFGFNILVTYGQILTETSKAAIIAYIMPALTAIFASVLLGERMGANRIMALAIGMAGIATMASEDLPGMIAEPLGPLIMAGSATSWALGIIATKAYRWCIGPTAQAVWFLGVSALACWPLVFLFEPPWNTPIPSPHVLWVLGWHILCPMLLCYALWTSLVGRLPASVAAIATLMAPVVAVSSSMILLGDPASWQKLTALGLIVLSIALTFLRRA
ncbi:MAG: DMT family transporter [Pseudomonadota bacterium]